jgi:hypothetical protein
MVRDKSPDLGNSVPGVEVNPSTITPEMFFYGNELSDTTTAI